MILPGEGEQVIAVHGGFVEVSGERVIVLSDVAELPEDIDIPRARAARERAEAILAADGEDELGTGALARAALRLEIAGETEPAH